MTKEELQQLLERLKGLPPSTAAAEPQLDTLSPLGVAPVARPTEIAPIEDEQAQNPPIAPQVRQLPTELLNNPMAQQPVNLRTEAQPLPVNEQGAAISAMNPAPTETLAVSPVSAAAQTNIQPRIAPQIADSTVATQTETNPTAVSPVSPSQQTQAEINTITNKDYRKEVRDANGNIIRARGADRDKKWSTKEKIGNAALGFLIGLSRGGLGGGIGEAVRGATDRNYNEKLDDKRNLAGLYPQLQQQQQQEDFQARQQMAQTQMQNSNERIRQTDERLKLAQQKNADTEYANGFRRAMAKVKLGYKRGENPVLDEELKRYGIEIDQYDSNNRTFWQGQNLMTFDERGEAVPVMDNTGKPVTDATRAPVEVVYDGQKYTVSNTVAYQGATNTGRVNTGIVNQNINDENEYRERLTKWENDVTAAGGNVSTIDNELVGLINKEAELKQKEEQLANEISALGDAEENKAELSRKQTALKQIETERRNAAAAIQAKKGDLSKAKQVYEGLRSNKPQQPTPRTQTQVPTVSGNKPYAGKTYKNPEALKSAFPNLTVDQIRKLVTDGGGTFIE